MLMAMKLNPISFRVGLPFTLMTVFSTIRALDVWPSSAGCYSCHLITRVTITLWSRHAASSTIITYLWSHARLLILWCRAGAPLHVVYCCSQAWLFYRFFKCHALLMRVSFVYYGTPVNSKFVSVVDQYDIRACSREQRYWVSKWWYTHWCNSDFTSTWSYKVSSIDNRQYRDRVI